MTASLVSSGQGPGERRLILLRHAKSAWDTGAADFDRPLAPRGRRAAERSARWLARRAYPIDLILCSPARRTVQTREYLRDRAGAAPELREEQDIYLASLEDLRRLLTGVPEARQCVLLIGHNPSLDELLDWMTPTPAPRTPKGKLLTTAAMAVLRFAVPWKSLARGSAELEVLVRPKMLNRDGEFVG